MSPFLATLVYLGVIFWLYRRDVRSERNVTRALWAPVIWITICSTRFVSQWLDILGIHLGGASVEEGSPLDALVFFALIFAGLRILNQRLVTLAKVVENNRCLTFFFVYCFVSILWSDFPFVALKRFLKDLGHPIMVLVLLTEPDPEEAIIHMVKRCAFICVPMSVLFIKYFPDLGRGYSEWTGAASYCGVTFGKNSLGLICFILGAFLFWYFQKVWRSEKGKPRRNELILTGALLGMIGWLFHMAQSSTSLVTMAISVGVLICVSFRFVAKNITACLISAIVTAGVAEGVFGVYTAFLHLLGKDPTLTDRTLIWKDLLAMGTNPIIGVGFESFWLGDRLKPLWEKWSWHPNEAHNGYLETYLDLGAIGIILLVGLFLIAYSRARRDLYKNLDWGRFRLAFLLAAIFYNCTEVPFRATNPIWFFFFLILMDYPHPSQEIDPSAAELAPLGAASAGMDGSDFENDEVRPVVEIEPVVT